MAWTTLAQEAAILSAAAEHPRVAVDTIGESIQGRPIRRVRIGDPGPPGVTGRAALLIIGCQHGHEPAGREAMLQLLLPELLATADPGLVALLANHGVVLIPTVNPDGFAAQNRENANNVDLNRDHIQLSQPETRALALAIGAARPMVVLDCHETTGTQTHGDDVAFRPSSNPQITAEVQAHSDALLAAVQDRMDDDSWSHSLYGDDPPSGRENRMLNNAGLRHSVALLIESHGFGGSALPEEDRRDIHYAVMDEAIAYLVTNSATVESDIAAGIAAVIAEGAAGVEEFDLHTGDTIDPPPLGYQLSVANMTQLAYHLRVYNLTRSGPAGLVLSMAQLGQPILPHLVDPDAEAPIVVGVRLFALPPDAPPPATVQEFAPLVAGSHTPVFEARLLTEFQTGNDPEGIELPILDGDVQFDATADVHATFTLTTVGVDEQTGRPWFPRRATDLLAPYGNEVFLRRGVDLGGAGVLWVPLGYFRIEAVEQGGTADAPITLSGRDRMGAIIDARPLEPREFPPTATVGAVVAQVVGEAIPDAIVIFDDESAFAPLGRTVVVEESRFEALREIADAFGKILFWDGEGALRIETAPDETTPVWTVKAGRGGVLIESARRVTREGVFNAVVAMGEAGESDTEPVRGVAFDLGPTSPTRWGGRFGRVPRFYASPLIRTEDQANAAARSILSRSLGAPSSADFTAVPNPALRPWHPVRVIHGDGNRELHVVQALTMPLVAEATMPATTREKTTVVIGAQPG